MSGFRDIMKEGWHPKGKGGAKESWRGDFKGIDQVAKWMGKDTDTPREDRISQPLSSLKDPAAFGPPPKHIAVHGGALPNETTPDRRGLGAPLSQEHIHSQNSRQQEQVEAREQEAQKPAAPPVPFRADRTGLITDHLPPPPVRRMDSPSNSVSSGNSRPMPRIPPRVPPRTNSSPSSHQPSPPPDYSPSQPSSEGYINQDAASRLSNAGVSVPALGIGRDRSNSGVIPASTTGSVAKTPVNELQTQFARMRTNTPPSSSAAPSPPIRGNTSTYESSPVSGSNTRRSSSTLQDFRERHNDKIQAGKDRVNGINDKYRISQRFNNFIDDRKSANTSISSRQLRSPPPQSPSPNLNRSSSNIDTEALNKKKTPPPPPPKPPGLLSGNVPSSSTPPPLPLSTKPR